MRARAESISIKISHKRSNIFTIHYRGLNSQNLFKYLPFPLFFFQTYNFSLSLSRSLSLSLSLSLNPAKLLPLITVSPYDNHPSNHRTLKLTRTNKMHQHFWSRQCWKMSRGLVSLVSVSRWRHNRQQTTNVPSIYSSLGHANFSCKCRGYGGRVACWVVAGSDSSPPVSRTRSDRSTSPSRAVATTSDDPAPPNDRNLSSSPTSGSRNSARRCRASCPSCSVSRPGRRRSHRWSFPL